MTIKYKLLGIPGNIGDFIDKTRKKGVKNVDLCILLDPDKPRFDIFDDSDIYGNDGFYNTSVSAYAISSLTEQKKIEYSEKVLTSELSIRETMKKDFMPENLPIQPVYDKLNDWKTLMLKNGITVSNVGCQTNSKINEELKKIFKK